MRNESRIVLTWNADSPSSTSLLKISILSSSCRLSSWRSRSALQSVQKHELYLSKLLGTESGNANFDYSWEGVKQILQLTCWHQDTKFELMRKSKIFCYAYWAYPDSNIGPGMQKRQNTSTAMHTVKIGHIFSAQDLQKQQRATQENYLKSKKKDCFGMAYRTENLLSERVSSCLSNCMTSWSRVIIVSFGKVLLALPCALLPTTACTLASCWSKILSESLLINRFTWKSPLNVSNVMSGCCVVAIA